MWGNIQLCQLNKKNECIHLAMCVCVCRMVPNHFVDLFGGVLRSRFVLATAKPQYGVVSWFQR